MLSPVSGQMLGAENCSEQFRHGTLARHVTGLLLITGFPLFFQPQMNLVFDHTGFTATHTEHLSVLTSSRHLAPAAIAHFVQCSQYVRVHLLDEIYPDSYFVHVPLTVQRETDPFWRRRGYKQGEMMSTNASSISIHISGKWEEHHATERPNPLRHASIAPILFLFRLREPRISIPA
ncbi:hypothetical protein VTI28DRAFT_3302 [Corynascus sepedonium]